MKTFIWNREYEVLLANADTVEQAREMLIPKLDAMLDPKIEEEKQRAVERLQGELPHFIKKEDEVKWRGTKEFWNNNLEWLKNQNEYEKRLLLKEPDLIIDQGTALIFKHINP